MDKYKFGAHKYFLYSIHEYFSNQYLKIENRKMQSLRQLLNDFIELEISIRLNVSDKDKLKYSRKALLNSLLFYFVHSPLSLNKLFKTDIELIMCLISKSLEGKEKEDKVIIKNDKILFNSVSSFNKKVNNPESPNILGILIDVHVKENSSFEEVDMLLECYVSELLYEGYSLTYLNDWYKENFSYETINNALDEVEMEKIILKFKELSVDHKKKYEVILSINLPENLKEEISEKNSIKINGIEYCYMKIEEFPIELKNDIKFKTTGKSICIKAMVEACDETKAVTTTINNMENYIEVYKVIDTSLGAEIIKGCATRYNEKIKVIELKNNPQYTKEPSEREKEDIQEFIELREKFRINNNKSNAAMDIERVINVVQKLSGDTIENKLLNSWGALENVVRFFEANSIIEKVNSIIPKVIVMYSIKREMNHLWNRILHIINNGKLKVDGLEDCKSEKNPKKYNKHKFAAFLLNEETGSKLYKETQVNISTNRCVAELNKLLKDPEKLKAKIIFEEEALRHNISTIYRLRNNLVHNGGSINSNVENNILVLKYYINCILGTLIHHIKRNPELTVEEVLNSIVLTYENYVKGVDILITKTGELYKELNKAEIEKQNILNKIKTLEDEKKELKKQEKDVKEKTKEIVIKIESEIVKFGIGNIAFTKYLYL